MTSETQKRRSERVLIRIPIRVNGNGADGKPFNERTSTLVINRNGARIGLKTVLRPDDRITITNLQSDLACPFRVVGQTGTSLGEGPEWGVECLQPGNNFWGISFPEKLAAVADYELIDALLECTACRYRELAQLTMEQYRTTATQSKVSRDCPKCLKSTEWVFGFAESPAGPVPFPQGAARVDAAPGAKEAERRRARRVTVKLPVRVRLQDGKEEIARTENISRTGVCFSSTLMMDVGERTLLSVGYTPGSSDPEVLARVVWRRVLDGAKAFLYGVHLQGAQ